MNKLRRSGLLTWPALLALVLCGCKGSPPPHPEKVLTIRIVHGPELRALAGFARDRLFAAHRVLTDGARIEINPISESGVAAAQRLAKGDLKVEAWIAPSSTLVGIVNSSLRNLGAPLADCTPLFGTPAVLAVPAGEREHFAGAGAEAALADIAKTLDSARENAAADSRLYSLLHGAPMLSVSGSTALFQLAAIAPPGAVRDSVRAWERRLSHYGNSDVALLDRVAHPESAHAWAMLTTEQQVAQYNVSSGSPRVQAVYFKDPTVWSDYQLCVSGADWVTAAHRAALKQIAELLRGPEVQSEAVRMGFRSAAGLPAAGPLLPDNGVDVTLPHENARPLSGTDAGALLSGWSELARPRALVVLVDTSGSMQGLPLDEAKELARSIILSTPAGSITAGVSFGPASLSGASFGNDHAALAKIVAGFTASGGGVVYDSLARAAELLASKEAAEYQKSILMITDGGDKNSQHTLESLLALLRERSRSMDLDLTVIGVQHPQADLAELPAIAEAAHGTYRPSTPEGLVELAAEFKGV